MKVTGNIITKTKQTDEGYFKVTLQLTCFKNQAPYFSATYELNRNSNFTDRGVISCGSDREAIAKEFPEFANLMKWHLFSLGEGPMYYVANSIYHASNRDHNGLLKGETRQLRNGKTGELCWRLMAVNKTTGEEIETYRLQNSVDAPTAPVSEYTLEYRPWNRVGEGKEPDLAAARICAAWPDAQLEDFTEEKLKARLPDLLKAFEADMLEIGLVEHD